MKEPVKILFILLLVGIASAFAIDFLFNGNGTGLMGGIGNMLTSTVETNPDELPDIGSAGSTEEAPKLTYNGGAQEAGTSVRFKSLFTVTTASGTKNGTVEDDFTIYLEDIRNKTGISVVECLSTEAVEALEEIPSAFIYDIDTDTLYFHKSGSYLVMVKVYGSNGTQEVYEFYIPVEIN